MYTLCGTILHVLHHSIVVSIMLLTACVDCFLVAILSRMLYAFVNHCRSSEECADTHVTVTYIVSGFVGGSANKVCRMFSCHTGTISLQTQLAAGKWW